jgi:hypothetical protein
MPYANKLLIAAPFIPKYGMRRLLSIIDKAVRINENNSENA